MDAPRDNPELLRKFLARRDVPCPNCGYNLRDLQTARCPECGLALRLPLARRRGRGAAWFLGLGAIMGSGAALGAALIVSIARPRPIDGMLAVFGLLVMYRPARHWLVTARALALLPRHKKQERVAVWWLGFLAAAGLAALAASARYR